MANENSPHAKSELGPEQLDAQQQQQVRDRMTEERLKRRRNEQDTGAPRVMQRPSTQPKQMPVTNASPASDGSSGAQDSSDGQEKKPSEDKEKPSIRERAKDYSKRAVRKRLAGAAQNVLGIEHQGRLLMALLALAVLKDSADIMSLSLLSWIDWTIDALLWVLYVLAFGNMPKKVRLELQVLTSFAALVEFVPFLDLFTTWTFLVVYSIFRAEMVSHGAFKATVAAFKRIDQAKPEMLQNLYKKNIPKAG